MRLAPLFAGLLVLSGTGTALGAVAVQVAGDRLTVRAEDASLQDILQAVAAAGHFPLHLDTSLTDPITVEIAQRPLLEVLVWLLREQSMLIRYTRDGDGVRVEDVRVVAGSPAVDRKSGARPGGSARGVAPGARLATPIQ